MWYSKCIAVLSLLCLLCAISLAVLAEGEVVSQPVEQPVNEVDMIELKGENTSDQLYENTEKESVKPNEAGFVIEDGELIRYTGLDTGIANIWVTDESETCSDYIEVNGTPCAPTSVKLNKTGTVSLALGKTLQLKATVNPSDAKTKLTW